MSPLIVRQGSQCLVGTPGEAERTKMRPHSMTIADTVKWSGIGRTKLYELLGDGKVQAIKLGTRTLVLTESVERFLGSLPRVDSA